MRGIGILSALALSAALSTRAFAQDDPKKLSCADYCLKVCQTKQDKNSCMNECPKNAQRDAVATNRSVVSSRY